MSKEVPLLKRSAPVLACAALAGLSLLWRRSPSFDPWAWLVWSRQLTGVSEVPFGIVSQTGWKPLPVLLQMPLSFLGDSVQPIAWVWFVRTCVLLCLVEAWRLGSRAAGLPAAVAAVVLLALTPQAMQVAAGGISEAVVTLAVLWGVRQHLDDRPRAALIAFFVAALARPEMLAIACAYGAWQVVRRRLAWPWLVAPTSLAVLLWAAGDWIGYGRPFAIAGLAESSAEPKAIQAGALPGWEILAKAGEQIQPGVAVIAFLAFIAAVAWREPVGRALGAAVSIVVIPVAIATQLGYPAVPRYLGPVLAVASVLAGTGIGRLASIKAAPPLRAAAFAAGGIVALGLALPGAIDRDREGWHWYVNRTEPTESLPAAIEAAGGRQAVVECGLAFPLPKDQHSALAYALDVRLGMEGDWSTPGVWRYVNLRTALLPLPSVAFLYEPALRRQGLSGTATDPDGLRTIAPLVLGLAGRNARTAPIAAKDGWVLVQIRNRSEPPCPAAIRFARERTRSPA